MAKAKERRVNHTPLSIHSIKRRYDRGVLDFDPVYQRNEVWRKKDRQELIDSLFQNYNIPKVYFRTKGDNDEGEEVYEVVDGQQRIKAILSFLNDEFKTPSTTPIPFANKKYSTLTPSQQDKFNEISIDVYELINYSDDDVEEMFRRLQKGKPLNSAEKLNAMHSISPGMHKVVETLAEHKMFKSCVKGLNKRFDNRYSVAQVLTLILDKKDFCPISLPKCQKVYLKHIDLTISNKHCVAIKSAYSAIERSFKSHGVKNALKKWSVLSLSYAITYLLRKYAFSEDDKKQIAPIFLRLEEDRKANDGKSPEQQDKDLTKLTECARNDSPEAVQYRHDMIVNRILSELPSLTSKDPRRKFTPEQRATIFYKTAPDYICQSVGCNTQLTQEKFEADHIIPWSAGGITSVENSQALCPSCNKKKGASDPCETLGGKDELLCSPSCS